MDNMENENKENDNKLNNNENKIIDRKRMAKVLSAIAFLAILFCGSYFITDYFNDPSNRKVEEEDGSEKLVLNQTPQALKDETVIVLKTKDKVDSEKTLKQLKIELSLSAFISPIL